MSYVAVVFKVMIASPSDVASERSIVRSLGGMERGQRRLTEDRASACRMGNTCIPYDGGKASGNYQ